MNKLGLKKLIKHWQGELGLYNYEINYSLQKNIEMPKKIDDRKADGKNDYNAQYKQAFIDFTHQANELTVIHELTHCLTGELVGFIKACIQNKETVDIGWVEYFEEKLVSELSIIFERLSK